jgi:predicted RNA-binding Zn-ribbon protein involved in translation (DUF1610 family)
MGSRGRDQLINCVSCGRRLPRGKAVSYEKSIIYSTDLKNADDVKYFERRTVHYCPSCGKSKGIYQKKIKQAMRKYNQ